MTALESIPCEIDEIARLIIDGTFKVHSSLGPGLIESVYEACLVYELEKRGLKTRRQIQVPVIDDGQDMDADLRLDLLVNDHVVVELKAVEKLIPLHSAQLLTYLKLSNKWLGLLINFNVPLIKDGVKRLVL